MAAYVGRWTLRNYSQSCVCAGHTAGCMIFLSGSGVDSVRSGCWDGDRRVATVMIPVGVGIGDMDQRRRAAVILGR